MTRIAPPEGAALFRPTSYNGLHIILYTHMHIYVRIVFFIQRPAAMQPSAFFKCLSDDTRLRLVLLTVAEGELCVCEFTAALQQSQPKVSRHLAQLRNCGLLSDRRAGQWVFYGLHPQLPKWCQAIMTTLLKSDPDIIATEQSRLAKFSGGPDRDAICC